MCYFNGRFNQLGRFSDYLLGDECLSFLLVYFMVRAVFFYLHVRCPTGSH